MNKKEISNKQYLAIVNQAYISLIHDNSFNGELSAKDYYLRRKAQEAKHASDILLEELGLSVEKEKPVEQTETRNVKLLRQATELFKTFNWTENGTTYSELIKFMKANGIESNRTISDLLNIAKENKILLQPEPRGKYYISTLPPR